MGRIFCVCLLFLVNASFHTIDYLWLFSSAVSSFFFLLFLCCCMNDVICCYLCELWFICTPHVCGKREKRARAAKSRGTRSQKKINNITMSCRLSLILCCFLFFFFARLFAEEVYVPNWFMCCVLFCACVQCDHGVGNALARQKKLFDWSQLAVKFNSRRLFLELCCTGVAICRWRYSVNGVNVANVANVWAEFVSYCDAVCGICSMAQAIGQSFLSKKKMFLLASSCRLHCYKNVCSCNLYSNVLAHFRWNS